jgi:HK97 family phage prohead protease
MKDYVIIAGYASTFNNIDKSNHIVTKEAIDCRTIPNKVPILFQHDFKQPIGVLLNGEVNHYGFYIEACLDLNMPLEKEVFQMIKEGIVTGISVGLEVIKSKYLSGILVITKANLVEISLTSNPVNELCRIEFCENFQFGG